MRPSGASPRDTKAPACYPDRMRKKLGFLVLAAISGALGSLGACSSSTPSAGPDASVDAGGGSDAATGVDAALAVSCNDAIEAVYGDPGALTGDRGAILKCATDRVWTRDELEAAARKSDYPYTGKPFTSGAKVFRVTFRTERGTTPPTPGYSSSLVFMPDAPTAGAPAVVAAHGTTGQAASCAPSRYKFTSTDNAFLSMVFPLVGAGYPVIAPDYAGYANYGAPGNPPSGYFASEDVGKSVLDGLRALRKLAPGAVSDKNIVVGHSQGGHAALSALALSETYGVPLTGVVAYAPVWFNQAIYGAAFLLADQFPLDTSPFLNATGLWYLYSHGELLDGQGKGGDIYVPAKRAAVKEFFDTACIGDADKIKPLGTLMTDLYTTEFVDSVKLAAAGVTDCGPTNEICKKWLARYAADRPHLTGRAATVPLLVPYGSKDDTLTSDRAVCGFERLRSDNAAYKVCLTKDASHSGVVGMRSGYVNDWIANVALGAPAPPACDQDEKALVDDAGAPIKCASPPPNN